MDCSPHAAAPSPEEEEVVVDVEVEVDDDDDKEEGRCSPRALLPQRGLLPNTKHGLRRLVSGFGLLGTFATFLLLVSLLLLFLQQYPSPTSSAASASSSSSSSSASAVSAFLSWFLPHSRNVSVAPARAPAPSPSLSPAPAPSPPRSRATVPAPGGTSSTNAALDNGDGRRPVSEGADKLKNETDRSAGGSGTIDGGSEGSVHGRTGVNSSHVGGGRGGSPAVAAPSPSHAKGSAANGSSSSSYGATKAPPQLFPTECDLFDGRWVKDDRAPYYPPGSCPFIDGDFDCHKNGRPDDGFLRWRWQPRGCNMPRLNATDFLSRLRGKRLIFVGDSLNRNMWESLVCILRNSIRDKNKVYEISRRKHFKTSGFYSFKFEDYHCSVDYVRSTFLVREIYQKKINGVEDDKLRLDILDETTLAYRDADVIVFNTGHWWTHEKTSRGRDYYQEGDHVYPVLEVMEAFKKALSTWARWVDMNINPNKTQVVFRGYSPTHFRGGQWNSGGQCHKESEPIMNTSYLAKYPSKMRALEQTLKTMRTPVIYLNISRLTDYRKDGHPSIYRKIYTSVAEQTAAEKSQDCSHWCLPGVPDTWNELLYASLLKIGQGTWKP